MFRLKYDNVMNIILLEITKTFDFVSRAYKTNNQNNILFIEIAEKNIQEIYGLKNLLFFKISK